MKKLKWLLPLVMVSLVAGISSAADFQVQTGFQFDRWDDTTKAKGSQVYIPFRLEAQFQQFSFSVLTGYAYTYYDPSAGESRSLNHALDTKLNFSYEILEKLPVDVLIGLDFNLPTGKTALSQKELSLIMDAELVSINRFGEGMNVNPTLTVAKEWGNWVGGIGIGYIWRGKYDYSTNMKEYDPGDIFNFNAEIRYDFSRYWKARLFGNYTWYEKDQVLYTDQYKEGDFFLVGLGVYYSPQKWDAGFTLRNIIRMKSKFQAQPSGVLAIEEKNSHGNEWIADLGLRYFLSERTTLKSYLQGLLIQENDYPADSSRYVGKRAKLSLGLGASRIFNPHLEAELLVKGFVMHDDEARFPEYRSARTYRGFSVGAQLTGRF
ncbi:MAG: hypothetical protein QME78_05395 [Thermodesulfobacteriota bacterium]|nr:hypothetical protein [Thermodesulfobacteriota bacterium]